MGWGTQLNYKDIPMNNTFIGFGGKFIKHDLYLEKGSGVLMDVGIHQRNIVDLDRFRCDVKELGLFSKNWKCDLPKHQQVYRLGTTIERKNLTLYNQWNIHKGYYTHGQGVKWKYNGFLNLKMGYFNDIEYKLNYPTFRNRFEVCKLHTSFRLHRWK